MRANCIRLSSSVPKLTRYILRSALGQIDVAEHGGWLQIARLGVESRETENRSHFPEIDLSHARIRSEPR